MLRNLQEVHGPRQQLAALKTSVPVPASPSSDEKPTITAAACASALAEGGDWACPAEALIQCRQRIKK